MEYQFFVEIWTKCGIIWPKLLLLDSPNTAIIEIRYNVLYCTIYANFSRPY